MLYGLSSGAQDTLYTSSENVRLHHYHLVKTTILWNNVVKCKTLEGPGFHFEKDSLFLIQSKMKIIRFYQYQPVTLFYADSSICLFNTTSGNGFKNNPIRYTYYFSKQLNGPIHTFTLNNLFLLYPSAVNELLAFIHLPDTALAIWDDRFQQPRIAFLLQHIH